MNTELIKDIEDALVHHSNYTHPVKKKPEGYYLYKMDSLAIFEKGNSKSERLCNLLKRYYKAVGVSTLQEALDRIGERQNV